MNATRSLSTPSPVLRTGALNTTSAAGLMLVDRLFRSADCFRDIPREQRGARGPEHYYTNEEIARLLATNLSACRPDFIDIEDVQDAADFSAYALMSGKGVPSEATVRLRLNEIARQMAEENSTALLQGNIRLLKAAGTELLPLSNGYIPLDIDTSPFDNSRTHKEGVSMTYKKVDGFTPAFAYAGRQGVCIWAEMREGKQHSQKGMPEFLGLVIPAVRQLTDKPVLLRMDSANDAGVNLDLIARSDNVRLLIKRNLRTSNTKPTVFRFLQRVTEVDSGRKGKKVFIGSTTQIVKLDRLDEDGNRAHLAIRVVYKITERTWDRNGQLMLAPEYELEEWYTTLSDREATDEEVIQLYCEHGASEQFHSEFKTDMDLERLPSGKFATNTLILQLAMLGFNALKIIGDIAMEMPESSPVHFRKVARRRVKTIIERLIRVKARITRHARRVHITLERTDPWSDVFVYVEERLKAA